MGLADELLKQFEHMIESLALIPSEGGAFEVSVNGQLIYSKLKTQRHAEQGEILVLITKLIEG